MPKSKPYKGFSIEGLQARWYARTTARALAEFHSLAMRLTEQLKPQSLVLEVAPGPGFLSVELARLGPFRITGLDISRSFVRMARDYAQRAGVNVDFQWGNASAMPFQADWFDLIVCRAAFKNFSDPRGALREMHRVLRPEGRAMILDMRRDVSNEEIAQEVAKMGLGPFNAFLTRLALRGLRRRAYTKADLLQMVAETPFGNCEITQGGIGFEVRLSKAPAPSQISTARASASASPADATC